MRFEIAAVGTGVALIAALPARAGVALSYYHPFAGSGGLGVSVGGSTPIGTSPVGVDFQLAYHHLAEVHTDDPIATSGWFSAHAIRTEFGLSFGLAVGDLLPFVTGGVAALFNVAPTFYQGQFDRDLAPSVGAPAVRGNYTYTLGNVNVVTSLNFADGFYAGGGVEIPIAAGTEWHRNPSNPRESAGVFKIQLEVRYHWLRGSYGIQGTYQDPRTGTETLARTGQLLYDGLEFRIGVSY